MGVETIGTDAGKAAGSPVPHPKAELNVFEFMGSIQQEMNCFDLFFLHSIAFRRS